ncbi:hypothetical protein [Streptomyces sp900116325]|uniref:hypothetical protein n=1 Tax=Streptomyces sp. 900116325 TaxID=3154295 RepID=UPI0033A70351
MADIHLSASPTGSGRSRSRRRIVAALLGAAALATLGTVTAPSAFASPAPPGGGTWDHAWSGGGATVYVEEHGDLVSVCDTSSNGHSAWVAVIDEDTGGSYKMTASGGKGTCKSHSAADGNYYNIPEGDKITLNWDGAGDNGGYAASFINDH